MHLTIETIGSGRVRPRRLILWTDPGVALDTLPPQLLDLRPRGLEIRQSFADIGPHKKYFPYAVSIDAHERPLVTADDDTFYPGSWLERLEAVGGAHPEEIVCYRAHTMVFQHSGAIAPYNDWPPAVGGSSSLLNFATGGSGVRYPAPFLDELRRAGDGFVDRCPSADDIWLHAHAVRAGRAVRLVGQRSQQFPEIAGSQRSALHRSNTARNANDAQIAATYYGASLAALRDASKHP